MGQCLDRSRVEEDPPPPRHVSNVLDISNISNVPSLEKRIIDSTRVKIHILEYVEATHAFVVLYRNKRAIKARGENDTSMLMGLVDQIVDRVIQRNETLHAHIKVDLDKRRSNDNDRSIRNTDARFKRAQFVYETQRESLELGLYHAGSSDAWYELCICQLYGPTRPKVLLVTDYEITKFIHKNERLMRMTDQHINLMQQVYPRHVLLKMGSESVTDTSVFSNHHKQVGVFFADIVGFTSMCNVTPHDRVMLFLNDLYSAFDAALDRYPMIYKYEVAGDCYIVVCGLTNVDEEGFVIVTEERDGCIGGCVATTLVQFALQLRGIAARERMPTSGSPVKLHIGIHMGPVTSGVVGMKSPRFMLTGDTMNTASRMESTCPSNTVQVTEPVYNLMDHDSLPVALRWRMTEGVDVKGKGVMTTYVMEADESSVPLEPWSPSLSQFL